MTARWHEPIDTRRLPLATALAAIVTLAVNVGIREAGSRWLEVPEDEPLLSLLAISIVSVAAALFGGVGLAALAGSQARPFTVFRSIAGVVLLVSCAGPLVARAGWVPDEPAVSTATMAVMLLMHVATAVVIVLFMTTLPRDRGR